jgi:hypothetical protein
MRSCKLAHLGAQRRLVTHREGRRPSSEDTSEPACTKRKMLSMKSSTSRPSSRKYSAMVTPVRPTRRRAPGGSFIWPKTITVLSMTPDSRHLAHQVVALAAALAHAGEDRVAAVELGHVVDQLLDDHRLAHAGAAEDAGLAAAGERGDQVDHLDAGLEDLSLRALLGKGRRRAVDRVPGFLHRFTLALSMGSPTTLNRRPNVAGPTGTGSAADGDRLMPRRTPSVLPMETVRTTLLPICCSTSRVSSAPSSIVMVMAS